MQKKEKSYETKKMQCGYIREAAKKLSSFFNGPAIKALSFFPSITRH